MSLTTEERQVELVDRLAAEARARVSAAESESVEHFVRRYFAHVAPDDIIYTSFEALLGGAMSLWEFGQQRDAGKAKVRIFNPSNSANGWSSDHTVLEIVNDDMPFLVDSVSAEIARRDRKIHLLLHPILRVVRDEKGRRLEITGTMSAPASAVVESYMHIEIDQETEPAELEAIRADLERVLGEVRRAVVDWRAMRERIAADVAEIETSKLPMSAEEAAEAAQFLRWLDDGNFVFLGYRRYTFVSENGQDYLKPEQHSGLGILREMRAESEKRASEPLSALVSQYAHKKDLIIVTKANSRSSVHKPVPMDRVGVKRYDATGKLVGEDRFLGLFTSAAYSRSVRDIPMVRLKARRVLERSGFDLSTHNGKALVDILETFPRDEMFQITDTDLSEISRGILLLQERQRVALFVRHDVFDRFVACHVYAPRDRYTPDFRERAKAILEEAFGGTCPFVYDWVTDAPLARGLFIVTTGEGKTPEIDLRRVEAFLAEAARTWSDRLLEKLVQDHSEESGIDLHHRYKAAFPMAYSERFSAGAALYDISHVEEVLATGNLVVDLYRHKGEQRQFHFKIIHAGPPVPLSEIMPRLENMGVRVQSEVPYEVHPLGASQPVRIRDFSLSGAGLQDDLTSFKAKFEEAFIRVWKKEAENDAFNKLVMMAELDWDEVVILRAYCKYLRQIGVNLSEAYIQQTLVNNANVAKLLIQLFSTQFDPSLGASSLRGTPSGSKDITGREMATRAIRAQIEESLERVTNPDEDRILRMYLNLMDATLRTNYYQRDEQGERKTYLSFKLDSSAVRDLPLPRPMFEIFVYSPWMEGIHLRGGKVARGGLRWSDRREDFRTEILGLMKAQNVKNVVIVPMGSKGGFVVKNPSPEREVYQQEGIESYRTLLRGMLDITDNRKGDEIIPPRDVVRRDPDDPYLVVAADKGTATFSDIANGVSAEYGFWLGDAFASGGSVGYDHKKMGITARGGWEAVKRHFREIGVDTQSQDFTVIGVGDMGGDVFGNAMLLSPHIKLVAAFNHSHIFFDPTPDPERSFAERRRLFDNRLNWNGYDLTLISDGGGVFERSAKQVTVSETVQRMFELPERTLAPADLIRYILRGKADLLWLGGIGTYVKASWEDHAAARDRSNDALRVSADELRVSVVGEGANLGFTQAGRIEFASGGGRINTDAIDNSAGVDTSDHEVNIKILLYDAIARGELSGIEERNRVLATMTDEVAQLVLRDNYEQTQAISITQALGESGLDEQARFMRSLERAGRLNRAIEGLPDDETIAERHAVHAGLTRPEIAVLLAYSKIVLYADLLASDLPDDPVLETDLCLYFPTAMREQFPAAIQRHRLRREIIATSVTNAIVNRVRPTFVWQVTEETGKPVGDVARAFAIVRESFDLRSLWSEIESLDNKLAAAVQTEMMIAVGRFLERAIVWLLKSEYEKLDIRALIEETRPRVEALRDAFTTILPESVLATVQSREAELSQGGVPQTLAHRIAALDVMSSALDIIRIARDERTPDRSSVDQVARVYFGIGAKFGLDRLRAAATHVAADTPWQKAAVNALVDDLYNFQGTLASRVVLEAGESVEQWFAARPRVVERVEQTTAEVRNAPAIDLAMLSVAARQVRALVES